MIEYILIFALISFLFNNYKSKVLSCGLIGYSGPNAFNMDRIRFLMLWNSVRRGRDSTGLYSPNNGLIKAPEELEKFVNDKKFKDFKPDKYLVAHVRAKTVGANNVANSHPFHYGNTILAHNGSLDKYHKLASDYGMKPIDWDVDSQILAFAISKNFEEGFENTPKILSEYQGAAALLFYNEETEYLYACHDKNRPLFYGTNTEGDMYISSIRESLDALELYTLEFDVNTLYTIKEGKIIDQQVYKTYEELYPTPPLVVYRGNNNQHHSTNIIPNLGRKQRGFTHQEFEPRFALGFNVRSQLSLSGGMTTGNRRIAKTTKDHWYTVTDTVNNMTYQLEILDDDNELKVIFTSNIDHENFLPVVGEYVKLLAPIQVTATKKSLWKTGDLALVHEVDFMDGEATLIHPDGRYTVEAKLFRVLTEEEREEVAKKNAENPFFDDEESNQLAIKNFLDVVREPNEDDFDAPKDIEDEEDEFIDSTIYKELTSDVNDLVEQLEENLAAGLDGTVLLNTIKARLSKSYCNYCNN